jgi:hypothetical protein
MTDASINHDSRRELAHRVTGGIAVTLYWSAHDNSTSVEIFHTSTEQTLHFVVPQEQALDAFRHPFAHLRTPIPCTSKEPAEERPAA